MAAMMTLYIKRGCPWCVDAETWLARNGIPHTTVDVLADSAACREMIRISGQSLAPVLVDGKRVLADFGPEELPGFLKQTS
jgi:glutaredoxin 3